MLRAGSISNYLAMIDSLAPSGMICRCCGSQVYALSNQGEKFCNLCEFLVDSSSMNVISVSADVEKNLTGLGNCIAQGKWLDAIPFCDPLIATKDPFFLYGASQFYKYFSDSVYYDVDYNQSGFMYPNAIKRSAEPANKYNAMDLIAKSKELLFKSLKMAQAANETSDILYLKFICNLKLKRYENAQAAQIALSKSAPSFITSSYSAMALQLHMEGKVGNPDLESAYGSANLFYYLARYFTRQRKLEQSITLLKKLTAKIPMPMASSYLKVVMDVAQASDLA